jgi:hypothetical protein
MRWSRFSALLVVSACGGSGGGQGDDASTSASETGTTTDTDTGSGTESGSETGDETGTDTGTPKLDVGANDDGGSCQGGAECGEVEFSYIWVANAPHGTVSKVDTKTLQETGRYWTRPDLDGNPSRTSVNVTGRAVAVANRWGGVVKIWADASDCEDQNGTPGIQTSSGKNDVLDWGQDDCVAWYTPTDYTTQRPVAWSAGELNPDTCEYENEMVWIAGGTGGAKGGCNEGYYMVNRLDGDTGEIVDTVEIDQVPCTGTGPYGGAVDSEGALWIDSRTVNSLIRVDGETLDYTIHDFPDEEPGGGYGIMADSQGNVWVSLTSQFGAVAARYDPDADSWGLVDDEIQSIGGVAETADGRMWIARYDPLGTEGLDVIDRETLEVLDFIASPDGEPVKGISVDVDGYVWAVTYQTAYKIDPMTFQMDSYTGLDEPYTYSDMTGSALFNAACPPAG